MCPDQRLGCLICGKISTASVGDGDFTICKTCKPRPKGIVCISCGRKGAVPSAEKLAQWLKLPLKEAVDLFSRESWFVRINFCGAKGCSGDPGKFSGELYEIG